MKTSEIYANTKYKINIISWTMDHGQVWINSTVATDEIYYVTKMSLNGEESKLKLKYKREKKMKFQIRAIYWGWEKKGIPSLNS